MGRPLCETAGGVVYHVLNRRVLRLTLFEDDGDYLAFERVLGEAMQRKRAPELFAFCLMPNHWHLLVRPRENGDLSKWMGQEKGSGVDFLISVLYGDVWWGSGKGVIADY